MLISHIAVENYRALRDVQLPVSRFACLIGENNAGKSSSMQAIKLFFSGTKLSATNCFDPDLPVRIAVTFDKINDRDLARLAPEHRDRVATMVKEGRLTLVRLYSPDGKSSLLYNTSVPSAPRFSPESVGALVKAQRPGKSFVARVLEAFPELEGVIGPDFSQDDMKDAISALGESLPSEQKVILDQPLKTGIDKSIMPMLPDPIYIPAVKDLGDDIKTSESTPFGKILGILLPIVEAKLPAMQDLFKELNRKLNPVQQADGEVLDERLDELKEIEATVQKYVRESFADVSLRISIPPPDLRAVLASAQIFADDGVEGLIDSKGDGLRRAIVFSILRSYVDLKAAHEQTEIAAERKKADAQDSADDHPSAPSYILMFEEPELFLHPKAQHILFDALRVFAKDHQVLVTTHSPMFLGPTATESFIKLRKVSDTSIAAKPFTQAQSVDVSSLSAKDQFQLICFENNNAAFFANKVVLVEGDSDFLLMPHIARTINSSWDAARAPVTFVRITGKGNIRRYRDFFKRFDVRVPVITDLDFLVQGFEHIDPCQQMNDLRSRLLAKVDALVEVDSPVPTTKDARSARDSGELKSLWKAVKDRTQELRTGGCTPAHLTDAVEKFYGWQRKTDRNCVLQQSDDKEMISLKHELLGMLREKDVFVLERGAIEEYYPEQIAAGDKPSRAQEFCEKVSTREAVLACCGEQPTYVDGGVEKEFNLIFGKIFSEPVTA